MGALVFILIVLLLLALYVIGCKRVRDKDGLFLVLKVNGFSFKGDFAMATLTVVQFIDGELAAVDRRGNPAPVEAGSIEVTSSDESVFAVERDADNEAKFKIVAKGEGVAQLDYIADADLGEGVKHIEGFTAIEVHAEQAVGLAVTLGEPQDQ